MEASTLSGLFYFYAMEKYYIPLMYIHLATIIPCIFIGTYLMIFRKGSNIHKGLGKIYLLCMLITGIDSLFMSARVGPTLLNHFGFNHIFSLIALYTVPTTWYFLKNGDIKRHQIGMVLLYIGSVIIAGVLALTPGRFLYSVLLGK